MKKNFLSGITLLAIILIVVHACKKNKEFIADDDTFKGFTAWSLDAQNTGADPALGAMAHGGNDSSVTRKIYYKDGKERDKKGKNKDKFPKGTLIVKHSSNPAGTVNEFTAMAKRGGKFNEAQNGWEWFMLNPDGSIAYDASGNPMRGADLMNGMCGNCHSAGKDFVFSK